MVLIISSLTRIRLAEPQPMVRRMTILSKTEKVHVGMTW